MGADRIPATPVSLAKKLASFQELLPQRVRGTFADLVIDVDQLEGQVKPSRRAWRTIAALAHAAIAADIPSRAAWTVPMPAACIDLGAVARQNILAHLPTEVLMDAVSLCGAETGGIAVQKCHNACAPVPRPESPLNASGAGSES